MAQDAKADEFTDTLRAAFAESLRIAGLGLPAHQVLQLADTLCTVQLEALAGLRVRYRVLPDVDAEAITEDWRRGLSLNEITRNHRVSRTTAYKHHPNTLARRAKAG